VTVVATDTSEKGNQAVDAVRYTYEADCPAAKVVTALLIVWPVLALTVRAVMAFVLLNVMVMPSEGEAGIVIVPVASVPAGFITNTVPVDDGVKVYVNAVVRTW